MAQASQLAFGPPVLMARETTLRIVIVGGGFTGAAIAFHMARLVPQGAPVVVVEPRSFLGGGLAYSTSEPAHRINVPAARMSLPPDDQEHFARWLAASGEIERDPDAVWRESGAVFPQRGVFGRYVAAQLAPHLQSGRVVHVCDRAIGARSLPDGGWSLELASGEPLSADSLVLATTHPAPATPFELSEIAGTLGFVADPYGAQALNEVSPDARVLIVGSGLTAADTVATLDRKGHCGPILALSRNGLRSRGHTSERGEWEVDLSPSAARGAAALVRAIRREITAAASRDMPWQWVLDAARDQGGTVWARLSMPERVRLVRRLRSFWDVHRFRIAPQVESVLDRLGQEGRFENIAARLLGSTIVADGLEVRFRRRGASESESQVFDLVVNTTGPSHRGALSGEGLLPALGHAGHLRCDPVGLGLDTDALGRAIGDDGKERQTLLVAGPLARGTFGELMGLPEVSRYALFIAEQLALAIPDPRA